MDSFKEEEIPWVPWPPDDEIRWVQWRVWERESIEAHRSPAWRKSGNCEIVEYRTWLLHKRDGLSFQQIGMQLFGENNNSGTDPNEDPNNPDKLKRRAYLAYNRVEREFHRGPLKRDRKQKGAPISDLLKYF
jgi:hypothetical protein